MLFTDYTLPACAGDTMLFTDYTLPACAGDTVTVGKFSTAFLAAGGAVLSPLPNNLVRKYAIFTLFFLKSEMQLLYKYC